MRHGEAYRKERFIEQIMYLDERELQVMRIECCGEVQR